MEQRNKRLKHVQGADVYIVEEATRPVEVKRTNEQLERALLDEGRVTDRLIDETDGYNLSYLRELAVQINFFQRSVEEVLERFEQKKRRIREAFTQPDEQLGFVTPATGNGT